jgi:hypothetical protein
MYKYPEVNVVPVTTFTELSLRFKKSSRPNGTQKNTNDKHLTTKTIVKGIQAPARTPELRCPDDGAVVGGVFGVGCGAGDGLAVGAGAG